MVRKNVHDNVVYVSGGYDTSRQYGKEVHLAEMHFITADPWGEDCRRRPIMFKNRHTPEFVPAHISRIADGEYLVEAERDIQGIAPGQFGVIYDPEARICYGSGLISGRRFDAKNKSCK